MTETQSGSDYRILSFTQGKWTTRSSEGAATHVVEERPSLLSSAIPPMWSAPVPSTAVELTDSEKRSLPTGAMRLSLLLSRVAYGDEKSVTRDTRVSQELLNQAETGFPKLLQSTDPHHATCHLWLFPNDKHMYVVFRGSGSVGESLTDVFSHRQELKGSRGLVHGGMCNQFNQIQPALQSLLQEYHDKFDKLTFTGHGIGAGIATIAAPFFAEQCSEKTFWVITYGGPRVGNEDFKKWFNEKIPNNKFRFIIEGDPLPNMPASSRYSHVQDAICLSHEGRILNWPETPSTERWDIPFGSLVMYIVSSFLHNQWEYSERITGMCSEMESAKRGL
jgi:hypothetical protein